MADKRLLILILLILLPFCMAFKPVTHYYLAYNEWQNREAALGTLMLDITRFTEGTDYHNYLHSSKFIDILRNASTTEQQRNFYYGYYYHTKIDLYEDIYASKEKKDRLAKLYPQYDNFMYEEAISYAIETILIKKDPSLINKIAGSLEQEELLEFYAKTLSQQGISDTERLNKYKQKLLIYLSAIKTKDYELIFEEETGKDLAPEEWNKLIEDAIKICEEDDIFVFLNKTEVTINNFTKPAQNPEVEMQLEESIAKNFGNDEKEIKRIVADYDEKLLTYIQTNPSQIIPLAAKLITTKPLFALNLLFTTKTGLFILGAILIFTLILTYIAIDFAVRTEKERILGISTSWLRRIYSKFETIKEIMYLPKLTMYSGIILLVISISYDLFMGRKVIFGPKQIIGIIIGVIIITAGFMFTGKSKDIRFLPINMQLFAKSSSYLLLALGLLIAIISVFYDNLLGKPFYLGIKQFLIIVLGIMLMFTAYIMKK